MGTIALSPRLGRTHVRRDPCTAVHSLCLRLAGGERFDIVASREVIVVTMVGAKCIKRWDPYTTGRARGLWRHHTAQSWQNCLVPSRKWKTSVRRCCQQTRCRRTANSHSIRMSSVEALLPEDLEKHVQLSRTRLTTLCRGHARGRGGNARASASSSRR